MAAREKRGQTKFRATDISSAQESSSTTVILAFDYGSKRIGVAVGDSLIRIAHPLTTVRAETSDARFGAIARLIADWGPGLLVVGLPLHMDGRDHELSASARRFARQLHGRFGIPVEMVDERLTSAAASEMLHAAKVRAINQKLVRDRVAAQVILQSYFDHGSS